MTKTTQYSDDYIEVIPGLDAVRVRPQIYLKDIQVPDELIFQALCHAIDEALDGKCSWIKIAIDRQLVNVEYNAGISLWITPSGRSTAEIMMTVLHACHNMKKHLDVGAKYCTLGLAVMNAFCDQFEIETISQGKIGTQVYIKVAADRNFLISESNEVDKTKFSFTLDREMVGDYQFDVDRLRSKVLELAQELNIKITID